MGTAARAGKFVCCETPLASNLEEVRAALTELSTTTQKVMLGFKRRFDRTHTVLQADIPRRG